MYKYEKDNQAYTHISYKIHHITFKYKVKNLPHLGLPKQSNLGWGRQDYMMADVINFDIGQKEIWRQGIQHQVKELPLAQSVKVPACDA